jgi:regulatory protein
VARDALEAISPEDEEQAARELVRSRLPRLAGLPDEVRFRRLAGLLGRKGFNPGLASRVVRDALTTRRTT